MKLRIFASSALATLLGVVPVSAQNTTTTAQGTTTTTSSDDQNTPQSGGTAAKAAVSDQLFAAAAASGGMAEVTISELGQQKATDPELKRFSQQMIQDHTRMNGELVNLAAQKQVALPRTPDARAQFCAQSLAGLSGQEFDKCYAKAQLLLHKDSVAMFEAEAERGQDPEMKALAAKALPKIKAHLEMIKPIAMRYEKDDPSSAAARHDDASGKSDSDAQPK